MFNKELNIVKYITILLILTTISGFYACEKADERSIDEVDAEIISNYLSKNNLTMSKTTQGVYYQIYNQSNTTISPKIELWSALTMTYTTKVLEGNQVDSSSDSVIKDLGDCITGLQYAIPNMTYCGSIRIIIPSSLAYGQKGNSSLSISGNNILDFDITILSATTNPDELY